jgi:hypothetical protein
MGSSSLTPDEARAIIHQMKGQDEAIFKVYACTLARVRTLTTADLRATGKRFWVRLQHRNGSETWNEVPAWLWYNILARPTATYKLIDHPLFSSPLHPDKFYSIQEINRKLRRYAELAGVRTDITVQDLRGVLMEQPVIEASGQNLVAECLSTRRPRDLRMRSLNRRLVGS